MSLGQRIREVRQARGLTQTQLGKTDVSKSFISLVERDRTRPSVETLRLFAQRLGTSVDSLLGQDGNLPETATESLLTMSREAYRRREYSTVAKLVEMAEFLVGRYGLRESEREVKLQRARLELDRGDTASAMALATELKTACQDARDSWRLGRVLVLMGRIKLRTRDFSDAHSSLTEALTALKKARASRDPARAEALILLGTAFVYAGNLEEGLRRYEEAASSDVAKRDASLRGQAHWGIGAAQRKLGRLAEARAHLVQARDAFESAEELPDLIRVISNIGQLDHEQGRYKEALRQFHHALRVAERINSPLDRGAILTEIGRVHLTKGTLAEAEHFATQALAQALKSNDQVEVAEAKVVLAQIKMRQADASAAIDMLKEALSIFRERGMEAKVVQTARDLGLLLKDEGAVAEAAEFLAIALNASKTSATAS